METKIESLIKILEERYTQSAGQLPEVMESTSGSIKYKLHPLGKDGFMTYSPFSQQDDFRVAAVDGGSLIIYETPTWNIGFYKLSFRLMEVNIHGKTCNTLQKVREMRHDLVFLSHDGEEKGEIIPKEKFENGEFLKEQETQFIFEQIRKGVINDDDLLLVDGTLDSNHSELLKIHSNTVGVSKRSFHRINNYSATSFLALKAADYGILDSSWVAYPLVKEYMQEEPQVAEMVFGTFGQNSAVFRIDVPLVMLKDDKKKAILQAMYKLGLCSMDPKYGTYPYPLGAVHSDAVMRKNDKEQIRRIIKRKLSELKKTGNSNVFRYIEKDIMHADWYFNLRRRS